MPESNKDPHHDDVRGLSLIISVTRARLGAAAEAATMTYCQLTAGLSAEYYRRCSTTEPCSPAAAMRWWQRSEDLTAVAVYGSYWLLRGARPADWRASAVWTRQSLSLYNVSAHRFCLRYFVIRPMAFRRVLNHCLVWDKWVLNELIHL